jgi:hypothetical protein
MSDLGDLLELLHDAELRSRTVRASGQTWHHAERARAAAARAGASAQPGADGGIGRNGEATGEERPRTAQRPGAGEQRAAEPASPARVTAWRLLYERPDKVRIERDLPGAPGGSPVVTVDDGTVRAVLEPGGRPSVVVDHGQPPSDGAPTLARLLLDPVALMGAFRFQVTGRSSAAGRPAIAATAVPTGRVPLRQTGLPPGTDKLELLVDAELGVLLRLVCASEGEVFEVQQFREIAVNELLPAGAFELPGHTRPPATAGTASTPERAAGTASTPERAAGTASTPEQAAGTASVAERVAGTGSAQRRASAPREARAEQGAPAARQPAAERAQPGHGAPRPEHGRDHAAERDARQRPAEARPGRQRPPRDSRAQPSAYAPARDGTAARPAAQPEEPTRTPREPVETPSQPVGKPSQPVGKPSQPVGKPPEPAGKPPEPVGKPRGKLVGKPAEEGLEPVSLAEAVRRAGFPLLIPRKVPGSPKLRVLLDTSPEGPGVRLHYRFEAPAHHLRLDERPKPAGTSTSFERRTHHGQDLEVWEGQQGDRAVRIERHGTSVRLDTDLDLKTLMDVAVSLIPVRPPRGPAAGGAPSPAAGA